MCVCTKMVYVHPVFCIKSGICQGSINSINFFFWT